MIVFTTLILFTISFSASVLIFLLHYTDFVYQYNLKFKIWDLTHYNEWKGKDVNHSSYLPHYIRETYKGFWPYLFGCPVCSLVFLNLILGPLVLVGGGLSLIFYFILSILYIKFSEKYTKFVN